MVCWYGYGLLGWGATDQIVQRSERRGVSEDILVDVLILGKMRLYRYEGNCKEGRILSMDIAIGHVMI